MAEFLRQSGPRLIVYETFLTSDKFDRIAEILGLASPALAIGPVLLTYIYYEKKSPNNYLAGDPERLRRRLDREAQHPGTIGAMVEVGLLRFHSPGTIPDYPEGCAEFVGYVETVGYTYKGYCIANQYKGRKGGGRPAQTTTPPKPANLKTPAEATAEALGLAEHSIAEQSTHAGARAGAGGHTREDAPPGGLDPYFRTVAFQDFLKRFTRKTGKDAAWEQWRVVFASGEDAELIDRIMTSLRKWNESEQWTRDNGRYVPSPAKWLADRPWDDDPPAPAAAIASNLPHADALRAAREANRRRLEESNNTDGDEDAE